MKVDKILAKVFGLELKLMNYKNEKTLGSNWDALIDKYGLLDHFSTVTPNLKNEFESISQSLHLWNFFGEMFRNVDLIEHCDSSSISLDDIITKHY